MWKEETIIFMLIAGVFFICSFLTISDTGVTLDEPFYFSQALKIANNSLNIAEKYEDYLPPHHGLFIQTLSSLFYRITRGFLDITTSLRIGTSVLYMIFLVFFYRKLSRYFSRITALSASIVLMGMPRVFFHSHLLALDFPVMVLYFVSTILFYEAHKEKNLKSIVYASVALGFLLATKVNGYFIFVALLIYSVYQTIKRREPAYYTYRRFKIPVLILVYMLSGVIFLAISPQYYANPLLFLDYLQSHSPTARFDSIFFFGHAHEATEFVSYLFVPFMLITTYSALHIFLAINGFFLSFKNDERKKITPYLLFIFVITTLFFMSPIGYKGDGNGERYILMLYPFLALFAGICFQAVINTIDQALQKRKSKYIFAARLLAIIGLVTVSAYTLIASHPFQSSYFNAFAGGTNTVARYNTFTVTYWLDELKYSLEFMNTLPQNTRIYAYPQAPPYYWYQDHGLLRKDIKITEVYPEYIVLTLRQSSIFPDNIWNSNAFPQLPGTYIAKPIFVVKNKKGVELLRVFKLEGQAYSLIYAPLVAWPFKEYAT